MLEKVTRRAFLLPVLKFRNTIRSHSIWPLLTTTSCKLFLFAYSQEVHILWWFTIDSCDLLIFPMWELHLVFWDFSIYDSLPKQIMSHRYKLHVKKVFAALCQSQLKALMCFFLRYFMDENDTDTRGIEKQSARISSRWFVHLLPLTQQPRSQGLSSLPPLVVGRKTLVAAGHVTTCDTNYSTGVESTKNFCRSQLAEAKQKVIEWTTPLTFSSRRL